MKKLFGALIIALSLLFLFGCDTGNSGNGDNNNSGSGDKLAIENLVEFRYFDEYNKQSDYKAKLKLESGQDYTWTISGLVNYTKEDIKVVELFAKKTLTMITFGNPREVVQDASLLPISVSVDKVSSECISDINANKLKFKTDSEEYTLDLCYDIK